MNANQPERSITLNPFILRKFGINKNRCLVRVDTYNLSCVPYRFSEKGCVLLLILSPREQQFLQKEENRNVTFHMEVTHSDYDRPVAQFFRARIGTFRELNKTHKQCLLTLSYLSVPNDYLALINNYYAMEKELTDKYNNIETAERKFSCEELPSLSLSKYLKLNVPGEEKIRGRIIEFSLSKISAAMDIDVENLTGRDDILIEIPLGNTSIPIAASLLNYLPSREIPGLTIVQLKLECSLCFIDLISPLLERE